MSCNDSHNLPNDEAFTDTECCPWPTKSDKNEPVFCLIVTVSCFIIFGLKNTHTHTHTTVRSKNDCHARTIKWKSK